MNQLSSPLSSNRYHGLAGQRILVTGAAGQLGREIVNGLLANGARVLAADASLDALRTTRSRFQWPHETVKLFECDIREPENVCRVFDAAVSEFGGLDMLVNNAGVSVFEPYLERTVTSIDWVMDVNIKGTLLCIQEFTKRSIANGNGGVVVNIASHYGLISPDPRIYTDCDRKNSEIYGATKAGIIQMTRYFSVHLSEHNIRVNAVSPGGVRNPDNPQGDDFQSNYGYRCPSKRMAETHEIVDPVLFLLSPASSYINGHNLVVDGAMSCW